MASADMVAGETAQARQACGGERAPVDSAADAAALSCLEQRPTCRVLEIGARFGALAVKAAGRLKKHGDRCSYTATDLASTHLDAARGALGDAGLDHVTVTRYDPEAEAGLRPEPVAKL